MSDVCLRLVTVMVGYLLACLLNRLAMLCPYSRVHCLTGDSESLVCGCLSLPLVCRLVGWLEVLQ